MKKILAILGAISIAICCIFLPTKVERVSASGFNNYGLSYYYSDYEAVWIRTNINSGTSGTLTPTRNYFWVSSFNGDLFYSAGTSHYRYKFTALGVSSPTSVSFTGLTDFYGQYIWGDTFYDFYSDGTNQYYMESGDTEWLAMTWTNPNFTAESVKYFNYNNTGNYYMSTSDNKNYIYDPNWVNLQTEVQFTLTDSSNNTSNAFIDMTKIWSDGLHYFYEYNDATYEYQGDLNFKFYGESTITLNSYDVGGIFNDGYEAYYCTSTITSYGNATYVVFDYSTNTWSSTSVFGSLFSIPNTYNNVLVSHGYLISYARSTGSSVNSRLVVSSIIQRGTGYRDGYDVGYSSGYTAGYEAGSSGVGGSEAYTNGYQAGYQQALSDRVGYNQGYTAGYNAGYNAGTGAGSQSGYDDGYASGQVVGYTSGYNDGLNDANQYTFYNLFGAVLDAPIKALTGLLNFELLGVNLLSLFSGLLALVVLIFVVKLILGGK